MAVAWHIKRQKQENSGGPRAAARNAGHFQNSMIMIQTSHEKIWAMRN